MSTLHVLDTTSTSVLVVEGGIYAQILILLLNVESMPKFRFSLVNVMMGLFQIEVREEV